MSSLLMTRHRQGDLCSLCCVTGPKGNPVTKQDLTDHLYETLGLSKVEAKIVVDLFF
ncbi:hypothetical protein [Acidithiobacillus sp.]|uniref:hypothetical protein n=1 Tax=Acidithiobacillus sp. TaxID=1872118 RepID=UPI003CFE449B